MSNPVYDDNDIHSAALCVWKEARGEGIEGMLAVLNVIHNRIGKPGFAQNLHDVIFGKNQFTSMSVPSDPEFNLEPCVGDELYSDALRMAENTFNSINSVIDPTNGALYYANLHVISKDGWFYRNIVLKHPVTAQIGKHTFFA